jgi:hypothetical protein
MIKLSELFTLKYGHSLELNRLTRTDQCQGIAFVSRRMGHNGISAYVKRIRDVEPSPAGKVTVALGGNGVLSAFLQERPFYTGRDISILSAKRKMNKKQILYYCMCITANRYRYSFGRQANRSLKNILVPKWTDLPTWIDEVEIPNCETCDAPKTAVPIAALLTSTWKRFRIGDLFNLKKGKRLTKANMRPGNTPFIGAVDGNNGLTCFVEQPPLHPANTITVNYNGNGVAEAFYQPVAYWCSDDVNVLYPRFALTPQIALFIAAIIQREKYRFSYGRKWHLERMAASEIQLPVKANGEPDWLFMEQYINSLPFSSQI